MSRELPAVPGVGGTGSPGECLPPQAAIPLQPPMAPSFYRDVDQDLDGSDPDGPSHPRSLQPLPHATDSLGLEQDPLTQMHIGENVGAP